MSGQDNMKRVGVVLGVAGIADSLYLLFADSLSCFTDVCGTLRIPFVPEHMPAIFGLLWFTFSLVIFWGNLKNKVYVDLWRSSGIFGIAFLGTYATVNSYLCPFCFTAYALGLAQIGISERVFG